MELDESPPEAYAGAAWEIQISPNWVVFHTSYALRRCMGAIVLHTFLLILLAGDTLSLTIETGVL